MCLTCSDRLRYVSVTMSESLHELENIPEHNSCLCLFCGRSLLRAYATEEVTIFW